jgi:GNAT superfamily N-acetyltransferase
MPQAKIPPVLIIESQLARGADLFARVFQHAPDMKYLLGKISRPSEKKILNFYQAIIRIGMLYGEVYTTSTLDGIAVWSNPENSNLSFGVLFQTGFLKALISMGLRPSARFIRSASYLENLKKQAITEACWILVMLGVEPSQQGRGIGGVLIQPVLSRADIDRVPCYVESADERNLSFYKKHGFLIAKQGQVPNGGPQVWVMVREPRIQ